MKKQNPSLGLRLVVYFGLGVLTGLMLLLGVARLTWHNKFYPGITIAQVSVGGLTREQAHAKIVEAVSAYHPKLTFSGASWEIPDQAMTYEIEPTLNLAYSYGRRIRLADYLLLLIQRKTNFPLQLAEGKTEVMEGLIHDVSDTVEIPPIEPNVVLKNGKVGVVNGSDGVVVDQEALDQLIRQAYANLAAEAIGVPTTNVVMRLSAEDVETIRARGEVLVKTELILKLDDERIKLSGSQLLGFLSTHTGDQILDAAAITKYVTFLSESLHRDPQDARFEVVEGQVKEFAPGKDGLDIRNQDLESSISSEMRTLLKGESTSENIEIPVNRTAPKVTTDKVNELGIRERIGRGESYYAHSIPNRVFNVGLAASRANSALIAPGEEFSFNQIVGEISGSTGYRTAYVISGGRTVLGDGGGVCQVSTTIFRAAMNAGLPITERWAHAYRVGYYEQNSKPGIDATVYSPSKDLRFRNDTPGHILVQTINDPKNLHLVVEIYGTSDGRVATVSEPKVWGITPPLPTVYQDDPSLPAGTTKQVDWAAAGAKASFEYKVVKDGTVLQEKTFTSVYRPWASVFLRGTGE